MCRNYYQKTLDLFKVISVDSRGDELIIYVQSTTQAATCLNCSIPSKRIHSYHTRKIKDLPVFGKASTIFLRSRKFYSYQDECPFKVFAERFENHFKPYKGKQLAWKVRFGNWGCFLVVNLPEGRWTEDKKKDDV